MKITPPALCSLLVCSFALLAPPSVIAAPSPAIGASKVLTAVGAPGYPEGIAVHDGLVYVAGPAAFGVAGDPTIFAYDEDTGALVRTIVVQHPNIAGLPNALSCLAFGEDDNLYVVDEVLGIVKINLETNQQSVYAAPFYPVFVSAFNPPAPVLINDLAFDKKGYLYVTDSFQATIWRVPPGGGAPQVWFQDPQIDGPFGPNGVRVDKKSEKLYFTVTFDGGGVGYVYTLPLIDSPVLSDLSLFHAYNLADTGSGPDGIAFGKSGDLYVALAGTSKISILNAGGTEQTKLSGPAQYSGHPPLPWMNPANIAFNNKTKSLLVTNHAGLVPFDPTLFAVFDVYVKDKAGKLFTNDDED